ncbi:MAG: domain S-box protein [Proteobacteria bacterium]|nr:domain S-box protein [Pseudomonadota bacterium]
MKIKREDIARIINGVAAAISLLLALCLPLGYGLVAYHDRAEELSAKARTAAAALNGLIAAAPDSWRYAEGPLRGLLARKSGRLEDEQIRVFDAQDALLAEAGQVEKSLLLTRSHPLFDGEGVVGRVEVSASLRSVAFKTATAGLLGLLLGALVFVVMQILPLRALRRVTSALLEEKEQGEALLRTLRRREAALQESEARFRALQDASFGGIAVHDRGVNIDCNQALAELSGYPVDELIGMDGMQLIAPEWRELVRRRTAGDYRPAYEIEGLRRDGTRCPLIVQGKSIPYQGRMVRVSEFRDISELRRSIEALRASEENLTITLHSIGDAVIATDIDGRVTRMNPTAERLTGWAFDEARGRPLGEVFRIIDADTRQTVANPVHRVIEQGKVVGLASHTVLLARDGDEYRIADSASPIRNARGEIVGVVLVFSDVTEKYRTEEALHETQAILRAAMDQTPAGIAIANANDGTLRYLNDAGLLIHGEDRQRAVYSLSIDRFLSDRSLFDLDGRPLDSSEIPLARAIRLGETGAREFVIRRADRSERIVMSRAAPIRNSRGEVVAGISVFLDITESKMAEEKIKNLAFYDQLTSLPNRRLLFDRLEQALAGRSRHHRQGALLFIDLDHFKELNDTFGHDVGDLLLQQVAQRLLACVREGDTVARIGGDEFVVMLDGLSAIDAEAANQAELVGKKILAALNQTCQVARATYQSSASIGIALFESRLGVSELLKRADLAMYQAKAAGRDALCFFDPQMQSMVKAHAALKSELREAILKEQFVMHYQPLVDSSGALLGAEALLRWQHPGRGLVAPEEFIPLAEESGLILSIGQWVVDTACAQLANWAQRSGFDHLVLSVNVSARQLHHQDFVSQVLAALECSGANPYRLKLELTESMLVEDVDEAIGKMTLLRAKGIGFSLDDFGTGYSSLSYLKRLPLDQLKIDRSLVSELLSDASDEAIVRTIVALGQSLGLVVIAEGVENEAQKERLASIGCHGYQGYYFARPLPLDRFERQARAAQVQAARALSPTAVVH